MTASRNANSVRNPAGPKVSVYVVNASRPPENAVEELLSSASDTIDGDPIAWTYLGADAKSLYRAKKLLPKNNVFVNAGESINRIADETQDEFVNLDRYVGRNGADLLWQTTDLAEKNPFVCPFLFRCCALLAFDEMLKESQSDFVALVEDPYLAREMANHATEQGFRTRFSSGRRLVDVLHPSIRDMLVDLRRTIQAVRSRISCVLELLRWRALRRKFPSTVEESGKAIDVLLVTWGFKDTFPSDSRKQTDTFFGELPSLLLDSGLKIAYLVRPAPWVSGHRDIALSVRASKDTVFLFSDCLSLRDVLRIGWTTFFAKWPIVSKFVVRSVDLSNLLKDQLAREVASYRQCRALECYYAGRFLASRGIHPSIVIFPYENQPWEKALRIGIKDHLPGTKTIAYQHSPFPRVASGRYCPSRRDLEAHQFADRTVVMGPYLRKIFVERGYPEDSVHTGPAFRFKHLLESDDVRFKEAHRAHNRQTRILVAASISYRESFEMVAKAVQALEPCHDFEILVKFHPRMTEQPSRLMQDVLEALDMEMPSHFSVTEEPIPRLLLNVDVVLHNGTTVGVEAMAQGIHAVHIQSDIVLDQNTLDLWTDPGPHARSPEEIRELVIQQSLAGLHEYEERLKLGAALLRDFFAPVREDTLASFFDMGLSPRQGVTSAADRSRREISA